MTTANDVRKAHELQDELDALGELSQEQEELLRSFLPERPKQKTLEEIYKYVDDAWLEADDPESKEWLHELHAQLKGLKDVPANTPALPAGMRLAEHEDYGRCVVSPKSDAAGVCDVMHIDSTRFIGSKFEWAHECELTFIDAEPAHPEFLETVEDYESAPVGTIAAEDERRPAWKPNEHWFINNNPFDNREMAGGLSPAPRRVLRWGWGE